MKIIIDADACPRSVLQICLRVGRKYATPVWTVASFNHNISSDHHITVGNASQEADIKVMNLADQGDIVITQDWGLAAMVIGKGAKCLNPMGRVYRPDQVDFLLEEREIKAKFRRAGGRTKGPAKRKLQDDRRFEQRLEACLQMDKYNEPFE
ncbi:YaiI/YqxD family protein [Syntrophomonas erecta]